MFSGIGNVNAVKEAFEELRNAVDPLKTRVTDKWKDESSAGSLPDMMVRLLMLDT